MSLSEYRLSVKIIPEGYNSDTLEYLIDFPNSEILTVFWSSFVTHFMIDMYVSSAFNFKKYLCDVNEGKPEDFMRSMKILFVDTNSKMDKDNVLAAE